MTTARHREALKSYKPTICLWSGPSRTSPGCGWPKALWVTHPAGAAGALAQQMIGAPVQIAGMDALRPSRFADQPDDVLTARSLALYRDIYATT